MSGPCTENATRFERTRPLPVGCNEQMFVSGGRCRYCMWYSQIPLVCP